MGSSMLVGAVALGVLAAGLAIWLFPRAQMRRWRRLGIESEEKLAELGLQARSNMTQALGGFALIVTIALTADQANEARRGAERSQQTAAENLRIAGRNLELAEAGQVSERFSTAIDQLGATNTRGAAAVDVRTGALFSLMRVGLDSESHSEPVFRVAAAYVANNYEPPQMLPVNGCKATFDVAADVQVALRFVLPAVTMARLKKTPGPFTGLRGATLNGLAIDELVLSHLDLRGVKFPRASLVDADFSHSRLSRADFRRACLRGANFRQADLRGARLDGAQLERASFTGAKFRRGDLRHAPLSRAQRRSITLVG